MGAPPVTDEGEYWFGIYHDWTSANLMIVLSHATRPVAASEAAAATGEPLSDVNAWLDLFERVALTRRVATGECHPLGPERRVRPGGQASKPAHAARPSCRRQTAVPATPPQARPRVRPVRVRTAVPLRQCSDPAPHLVVGGQHHAGRPSRVADPTEGTS